MRPTGISRKGFPPPTFGHEGDGIQPGAITLGSLLNELFARPSRLRRLQRHRLRHQVSAQRFRILGLEHGGEAHHAFTGQRAIKHDGFEGSGIGNCL